MAARTTSDASATCATTGAMTKEAEMSDTNDLFNLVANYPKHVPMGLPLPVKVEAVRKPVRLTGGRPNG